MPRRKTALTTGGGEPSGGAPGANAKRGRHFTPEERRQAVETFEKAGLSQRDFARTYGISEFTLGCWRRACMAGGPQGLERLA